MSEAFGAGDYDRLRKILANMLLAGFTVCCTLALAGIVFADRILSLLAVPREIYGITAAYLRITFLGVPFTFCYNALTAGLKSVGDADTPLKFLAFSAILNAVLDLVFGWGGLPDNYLFSFLLLSLAGGVLQIVAFTELVIKRLRYTLRLFVFAVPYLAVLSAIAAGFGWLPAAQPGAWALFFLIFLAVLLTMTLGFELYYRISGKKYDGLLGQYRASRTRDENSRGEY